MVSVGKIGRPNGKSYLGLKIKDQFILWDEDLRVMRSFTLTTLRDTGARHVWRAAPKMFRAVGPALRYLALLIEKERQARSALTPSRGKKENFTTHNTVPQNVRFGGQLIE